MDVIDVVDCFLPWYTLPTAVVFILVYFFPYGWAANDRSCAEIAQYPKADVLCLSGKI